MSEAQARPRWKVLLPLLLATVGLVAWLELSSEPDAEDVVSPVVRQRQPSAAGAAVPQRQGQGPRQRQGSAPAEKVDGDRELRIERTARTAGAADADGKRGDPFARTDWNPPPPPPPKASAKSDAEAAAPPKPVAPPVPYTYFGMSTQDGRTVVFVTRQERTFVLDVGETVENRYRVEEIRPTEVVLTYIPLNERQVMMIGTAKP